MAPSERPDVLLDDGRQQDIWTAHAEPGLLHLAVSVQVVDGSGRWLLQRRSRTKPLFALRWANSSCTHPTPWEQPQEAASRRLREELGLVDVELFPAGSFVYRAADPVSGLVEHERDHVFVGFTDAEPVPDASDVAELWDGPYDEAVALVSGPEGAPWALQVLGLAAARVRELQPQLFEGGDSRS